MKYLYHGGEEGIATSFPSVQALNFGSRKDPKMDIMTKEELAKEFSIPKSILSKIERMEESARAEGKQASYRFNFDVDWVDEEELGKRKERKLAKKTRKEAKHVANVTVTPNQDQEYDIDDVVKKLEECGTKPKKKQKKKKDKDKDTKSGDKQDVAKAQDWNHDNLEKAIESMTVPDQLVVEEPNPNIDQNLPIDQQSPDLPSELECSTCFEPRIRTFALLPCGHATFCENCATCFCESPDKR